MKGHAVMLYIKPQAMNCSYNLVALSDRQGVFADSFLILKHNVFWYRFSIYLARSLPKCVWGQALKCIYGVRNPVLNLKKFMIMKN